MTKLDQVLFNLVIFWSLMLTADFLIIKVLPKDDQRKICPVVRKHFRERPFVMFGLGPGMLMGCGLDFGDK